MLEVIKYLDRLAAEDMPVDLQLSELKSEYGIKSSSNPEYPDLVVLNYDQIQSPRFARIVEECRSLVLSVPKDDRRWHLVSRSYDRFYNVGETDCVYDMEYITAHEKLDGSLVGIFWYGGKWLYRTKSMIMPDLPISGADIKDGAVTTWDELIGPSARLIDIDDNYDCTYILEVTSNLNRIVTEYTCTELNLLSIRSNITGGYKGEGEVRSMAELYGWRLPKVWKFSSMEECIEAANSLGNLREGFVLYGREGKPVAKVKSKAYIAAHAIRGELGLTFKRMFDLIQSNEYAEYLSVFPEDSIYFDRYDRALKAFIKDLNDLYADTYCTGMTNKDMALALKGRKDMSLIMTMFNYSTNAHTAIHRMLPKNIMTRIGEYYARTDIDSRD